MGIRGKLLFVLLALTVGPLAALGWLVRSATSDEQWQLLGGLTTIIILISLGFSIFVSRRISQPLNDLHEAARKLSNGDLSVRVDIPSGDELGDLGAAFNRLGPRLREHVQLKETLSLAEQVQKNLLPHEAPDIPGYDIAGFNAYCDETGGDYYDFLHSDDPEENRVGIVVGDVSGHGVASALLMATVRGAVWGLAKYETDLGEGVREINNQLVATANMGRFMTFFCLVIDYRAHGLQWVNAGHDPALVYIPSHDRFDLLNGEDIPLGIEADWQFQAHGKKRLEPGGLIIIGTDGIWEARNDKGEEFGKEAFQNAIRRNAGKSAAGICQAIDEELTAFRGDAPQRDDITLVAIKNLIP